MIVSISISGGRTSAYMAHWMEQNRDAVADFVQCPVAELEYVYTFANTGMEHDDTLRFLNDVDQRMLGGQVVWLEAVVDPRKGVGTGHRVVTYETATRSVDWMDPQHPFHQTVRKFGVPNKQWLHCTREMKRKPMTSYMRQFEDFGWTAIGIRDDENRRVSANATKERLMYPLVDLEPTDKQDVLDFWAQFDWDLKIPEWQGNCVTCHKKSFKKLNQVYTESPRAFNFNNFMELEYGWVGPEFEKHGIEQPRVFFRQHMSTQNMIALFRSHDSDPIDFIDLMGDDGCSESCEVYETESI